MYKKALGLSFLITVSAPVMAESIYHSDSVTPSPHHEATAGGVGLVIGSLAGGPLGAIIGGSIGVITGNNQSKIDSINEQKASISKLEKELDLKMAEITQLNDTNYSSQQKIQRLEKAELDTQQQHRLNLVQFANSYQFDIYFMTNSDVITSHAQQGLIKLAQLLNNNKQLIANIESHSDWRGSDDVNCLLAGQRLTAVTDQLLQAGSQSDQLMTTSYGEHANINQGVWGEELFYDRRVTITLNYFE